MRKNRNWKIFRRSLLLLNTIWFTGNATRSESWRSNGNERLPIFSIQWIKFQVQIHIWLSLLTGIFLRNLWGRFFLRNVHNKWIDVHNVQFVHNYRLIALLVMKRELLFTDSFYLQKNFVDKRNEALYFSEVFKFWIFDIDDSWAYNYTNGIRNRWKIEILIFYIRCCRTCILQKLNCS